MIGFFFAFMAAITTMYIFAFLKGKGNESAEAYIGLFIVSFITAWTFVGWVEVELLHKIIDLTFQ